MAKTKYVYPEVCRHCEHLTSERMTDQSHVWWCWWWQKPAKRVNDMCPKRNNSGGESSES